MLSENRNEFGSIAIGDEVIATLAGAAAMECYGLVGMASRRITDGFVELLGRDNWSRGVEVKLEEDRVYVTLHIIVSYGVRISEVAKNVMEKVKYAVESVTGLKVARVDVYVQGVQLSQARPGGQKR
ncbi:Asp23/Gls24 family envelope stress response protein [Gelria sp. Kuro-4]|uniref:Asp23/Gls24 family envelope stress response protein n=1 Tax=Gelria sp. Kuro-4 TaxID=2796927 RepID=UPI001BEFF864|nr:Asp23/Gls24 family envelope stress response protein [Gelria sp. Kuro-4]BCV24763.1 Asp23/Gls24 family envelope stress response protein [Gelria sp. Kuro-4]